MSIKSLELYDQIAITDRFQEYSTNFATAEDRNTDLVTPGLDSIVDVPIQFIVAADDTVCTPEQATRLSTEIPAVTKTTTLVDTDHSYFFWNNDPTWVQQLSSEIQACIGDDCKSDDKKHWGWIFGGSVTGLILLLVLIICCCCKKEKED